MTQLSKDESLFIAACQVAGHQKFPGFGVDGGAFSALDLAEGAGGTHNHDDNLRHCVIQLGQINKNFLVKSRTNAGLLVTRVDNPGLDAGGAALILGVRGDECQQLAACVVAVTI